MQKDFVLYLINVFLCGGLRFFHTFASIYRTIVKNTMTMENKEKIAGKLPSAYFWLIRYLE